MLFRELGIRLIAGGVVSAALASWLGQRVRQRLEWIRERHLLAREESELEKLRSMPDPADMGVLDLLRFTRLNVMILAFGVLAGSTSRAFLAELTDRALYVDGYRGPTEPVPWVKIFKELLGAARAVNANRDVAVAHIMSGAIFAMAASIWIGTWLLRLSSADPLALSSNQAALHAISIAAIAGFVLNQGLAYRVKSYHVGRRLQKLFALGLLFVSPFAHYAHLPEALGSAVMLTHALAAISLYSWAVAADHGRGEKRTESCRKAARSAGGGLTLMGALAIIDALYGFRASSEWTAVASLVAAAGWMNLGMMAVRVAKSEQQFGIRSR